MAPLKNTHTQGTNLCTGLLKFLSSTSLHNTDNFFIILIKSIFPNRIPFNIRHQHRGPWPLTHTHTHGVQSPRKTYPELHWGRGPHYAGLPCLAMPEISTPDVLMAMNTFRQGINISTGREGGREGDTGTHTPSAVR